MEARTSSKGTDDAAMMMDGDRGLQWWVLLLLEVRELLRTHLQEALIRWA